MYKMKKRLMSILCGFVLASMTFLGVNQLAAIPLHSIGAQEDTTIARSGHHHHHRHHGHHHHHGHRHHGHHHHHHRHHHNWDRLSWGIGGLGLGFSPRSYTYIKSYNPYYYRTLPTTSYYYYRDKPVYKYYYNPATNALIISK